MKTLEDIRNQVAKKHGFGNWEDLQAEWLKRTGMINVVHESYVDEAAKLFAQEACREQREICANSFKHFQIIECKEGEKFIHESDARFDMLNATEPKF